MPSGLVPGTDRLLLLSLEALPVLLVAVTLFVLHAVNVNPRDYLRRIYVDSLVHDADALRTLLKLMGPERIALGTDYPFPLGETTPGKLIESMKDVSPAARERMLSGTALEFLGLTKKHFR